ncbi:hypothetical protein FHR84_003105 [Actinopolyspora biskrensis]|uniref:Uncharacterized protein n=1 Tax=Actinopolyspora biskrensis TaxID=1470178 RepID=A0A852ZB01_9ACTN|nr:hypothetical protein [Actinopolyspora biskrensis]
MKSRRYSGRKFYIFLLATSLVGFAFNLFIIWKWQNFLVSWVVFVVSLGVLLSAKNLRGEKRNM